MGTICTDPQLILELETQAMLHSMAMRRLILGGPERYPDVPESVMNMMISLVMRQN